MAVPRGRISNARKNKRRAHHAKKPVSLGVCKNCNKNKPMHRACPYCGTYKGRSVFKTAE